MEGDKQALIPFNTRIVDVTVTISSWLAHSRVTGTVAAVILEDRVWYRDACHKLCKEKCDEGE
jgi:hypothetical protein